MPYVNVDIELDEFDLDDILDEVKDRYFRGKSNKKQIEDFLKTLKIETEDVLETASLSLLNKMKVEFLMENINNISLNDLGKLI